MGPRGWLAPTPGAQTRTSRSSYESRGVQHVYANVHVHVIVHAHAACVSQCARMLHMHVLVRMLLFFSLSFLMRGITAYNAITMCEECAVKG